MSAKNDDNEPLKFPKRTKVHDADAEEREKSLIKGRMIYEDWKKAAINTPATPDELLTRLHILRELINRNIPHEGVRETMLKQVDESIKKAAKAYPPAPTKKSARAAKRDAWTARASKRGPNARRLGGEPPGATGAGDSDPALN